MKKTLKNCTRVLLPFCAILLLSVCAAAQEAVATQGGFVSTGSILYTFTVGECFTATLNNPAVVV